MEKKKVLKILGKLGLGLACTYPVYLLGGFIYQYSGDSESNFIGHYNKQADVAESELKEEIMGLEYLVKNKYNPEKANVSVNIFIHTDVKRCFDDADNPDDDGLWVEKVKNALEGFDIYEKEGFNFTVRSIGYIDFQCPHYAGEEGLVYACGVFNNLMASLDNLTEMAPPANFNFYFLPPSNTPMHSLLFGFATNKGNRYAVTFLNKDDLRNESTFAHEMGHLLGLIHPRDSGLTLCDILLDPFGRLMKKDIMGQGTYKPKYKLSESDLKHIKALAEIIRQRQGNH